MDRRRLARVGLIALILLLLGILSMLAVNLVPLLSVSGGTLARTVSYGITSEVSLSTAGALAGERAAAWASDAVLTRLGSVWYPGPGWATVDRPPLVWVFSYYSPSTRELASVAVDDDKVMWIPPREIPSAPVALAGLPDNLDPGTAWLTFRAAGGDELLRQDDQTQVSFQLIESAGSTTWVVMAYGMEKQIVTVIDAGTGALVSSTQSVVPSVISQ